QTLPEPLQAPIEALCVRCPPVPADEIPVLVPALHFAFGLCDLADEILIVGGVDKLGCELLATESDDDFVTHPFGARSSDDLHAPRRRADRRCSVRRMGA